MSKNKVRYAVIGLGWIAQDVIIPAFAKAKKNSQLVALISDDPLKLKKLGDRYNVPYRYSYDEYGKCLQSGQIDAVYIALPNSMHKAFTIRAAKAGIHVLCEKPMAMTEEDCKAMIKATQINHVKLMIAYRLHFEEGNLKAAEMAHKKKLGEIRFINSTFSMNVKPRNIRRNKKLSGGTLYDIGIYCINAARMIFKSEPQEVTAFTSPKHPKGVEQTMAVLMRFSGDRLAMFVNSFAANTSAMYEIVGTKGSLKVDPAFHHKEAVHHELRLGENKKKFIFPLRDQFAPEIIYFSECIHKDKTPEPSGTEGLADVRIIEALYKSARTGTAVSLGSFSKNIRPSMKLNIHKTGTSRPSMVRASAPSMK